MVLVVVSRGLWTLGHNAFWFGTKMDNQYYAAAEGRRSEL